MKSELGQWGNSLAVRIPKQVAEQARLKKGQPLELVATGPGKVEIRSRSPKPSLARLVSGITPENRHDELDWGRPMGRELW